MFAPASSPARLTRAIGSASKLLTSAFFHRLCHGQVIGLEQLEALRGQSYILAPNHGSHLDFLVLQTLFLERVEQPLSFLAKKELFESRFWSHIVDYGGAIAVDRERLSKAVLKELRLRIEKKHALGIFPEGTRSPDGELLPGKLGVARLALLTGLPVVPVGLRGFSRVLPKHAWLPRPQACEIHVGKALYFKRDMPGLNLEEMTNRLMAEIAKLAGRELPPTSLLVPQPKAS